MQVEAKHPDGVRMTQGNPLIAGPPDRQQAPTPEKRKTGPEYHSLYQLGRWIQFRAHPPPLL